MKKILAVVCALCVAFALGFNLPRQSVQAQTVQSASVKIGQSVEYGLQKQITHYENLLEKESSQEKRAQILRLIQTTENLLSANSARACATTEKDEFHLVFSSAAASVIAYFTLKDYYFAAELMTHACENDLLNSIYYPVNAPKVKTAAVFEEICANDKLSGTGRFARQGSVEDMDLYYAIHQFNYSKIDGGKRLVINDRYDFIRNGGFVWPDELPIQVMYEAQEAGVVMPFYSVIDIEIEPVTGEALTGAYRHLEYVDGVYHIYNDVCDGSCNVNGCSTVRPNSHKDEDHDEKCDVCKIVIENEGKTDFSEKGTYFKELWNRFRSVKNKVENRLVDGCNGALSETSIGCVALLVGSLLIKKGGKKK